MTDAEFMKLPVPVPTLVLETVTKAEARLHAIPYVDRDYVKQQALERACPANLKEYLHGE